MTGCTSGGYDQLDTNSEAIEQELRPAVCEHRQIYGNSSTLMNRVGLGLGFGIG